MNKHILKSVLLLIGIMGALSLGVVNAQEINKDIILEATVTEAGQTIKINKYFANAYTVNWGDGTTGNLISDTIHTYSVAGTYDIILSLSGANRWTFQQIEKSLVPTNETTMTGVKIIRMPSLASGFGNSATNPGHYFFSYFNRGGALTSLPEGSFDTSNITTVGRNFFSYFNRNGQLTNLPEGSFDTSNITTVGRNFFSYFNRGGALTNLPEGSFDTSKITTAGDYFFYLFNGDGQLTTLPTGSFDTSNITTVGDSFFSDFNHKGQLTTLPTGSFDTSNISGPVRESFFSNFNRNGQLTSLPEGSFDTSKITTARSFFFDGFNRDGQLTSLPTGSFDTSNISGPVGNDIFSDFNRDGQLTSLPTGSFDTSNISGSVRESFFSDFNRNGQLTSLPEGSFDTSKITTVGIFFFSNFNYNGQLTSLPEGSFDTSKITKAGAYFIDGFNYNGQLTSLPEGSFDISNISGSVGDYFFSSFNSNGQLTSLPEGSFDTSKITTAGNNFFSSFNRNGQLTSLPEGSFDTSNMTTVRFGFFVSFNSGGQLTSLPEGSFDTSKITTAGDNFIDSFNYQGALISLPNSFKLTSVVYNKKSAYQNAFNSPNYTINRKVLDLVEGIEDLTGDQNVFSDNQPGRCGVHPNWLVNPANACSISYDDGLGVTGELKYDADTTGVVIGSGIVEPTRIGYTFSGWQNASGNKVEEILFPEMDGQTLYANRQINQYTITFDLGDELIVITGDYGSPITKPSNPSKNGYKFIGWEPEIPSTIPAEDLDIKAVWEKLGSSGGGGGGGGGSSSQSNTGSAGTQTGGNAGGQTGNNAGMQTGSQINSNTGDTASSGANEKEPENGTGSNVQTGSQTDSQLDEQALEETPKNDNSVVSIDSEKSTNGGQNYSQEFQQAYEFAHENGITTMPTIQQAQMDGKLTRIAMAKMLSQYAMNILGQKPENIVVPKFDDVTEKIDSDYDEGVTLAYQLGIMGQNMPNNNFRPNDEVTRAEFATALSRMIYGTSDGEYKGTGKYYVHHMEKLVKEGIITKDDPNMKELRGYVMIMLMRSAK